jgi:hypothetical protein
MQKSADISDTSATAPRFYGLVTAPNPNPFGFASDGIYFCKPAQGKNEMTKRSNDGMMKWYCAGDARVFIRFAWHAGRRIKNACARGAFFSKLVPRKERHV